MPNNLDELREQTCKVPGCTGLGAYDHIRDKRYLIHGYCGKHNARLYYHGDINTVYAIRDGRKKHKLYSVYRNMITRCYHKNNHAYKYYGELGVVVCDRWLDRITGFWNFASDMDGRPSLQHTLDRIDVFGNYEPSNCRWATWSEQASNI